MSSAQPTKKWLAMAALYRRFASDYPDADYSDAAALAMFLHESRGEKMPETNQLNGFVLGKKWMDVTVAMWREDIPQMGLSVNELRRDGWPDWFLERVGILHLRPTEKACAWWLEPNRMGTVCPPYPSRTAC